MNLTYFCSAYLWGRQTGSLFKGLEFIELFEGLCIYPGGFFGQNSAAPVVNAKETPLG